MGMFVLAMIFLSGGVSLSVMFAIDATFGARLRPARVEASLFGWTGMLISGFGYYFVPHCGNGPAPPAVCPPSMRPVCLVGSQPWRGEWKVTDPGRNPEKTVTNKAMPYRRFSSAPERSRDISSRSTLRGRVVSTTLDMTSTQHRAGIVNPTRSPGQSSQDDRYERRSSGSSGSAFVNNALTDYQCSFARSAFSGWREYCPVWGVIHAIAFCEVVGRCPSALVSLVAGQWQEAEWAGQQRIQ